MKNMTGSNLKIIAILSMFIDHVGAVLFPEIIVFRVIGRIAFPVFAFLLVQGYHHTGDLRRYFLRLTSFALISEVPFDLAFFDEPLYMGHQNIFFTLALGLAAIYLFDRMKEKNMSLSWLLFFMIAIISEYLRLDYGILGMITILLFHMHYEKRIPGIWKVAVLHIFYGLLGSGLFFGAFIFRNSIQAFAVLAMPVIALYNGEKGISLKYVFYSFYPLHLAVLAIIG